MPEYLAPGVYVEEVDTGSKPIEGVSTSTAGMLGVTERGPVNVPILVTGMGEYTRWFGERLNVLDFSNGPGDPHCFLPHGVEGFFSNGGKRVYVTRVLDTDLATRAVARLFDRGTATSGATLLLRAARANTGTAANPPLPVVLSGANLALNDWVRVGDGSDAEYRRLVAAPAPETVLVPLSLPLNRSHVNPAAPINVEQFTPAAAVASFAMVSSLPAGAVAVEISGSAANISALAQDQLLEIGATPNVSEHRFIRRLTPISPTNVRVTLDSPLLMPYPGGGGLVRRLNLGAGPPTAQLDPSAGAGESLLFVNNRGGQFTTRTDLVVIDSANNAQREVRRIGELHELTVAPTIRDAYPAASLVEGVALGDRSVAALTVASGAGTNTLTLNDVSTLGTGQTLLVGPAAGPLETVVVQSIDAVTGVVTLVANLVANKAIANLVFAVRDLTAPSVQGSAFVSVTNRRDLQVGDVVRVGAIPDDEYATILGLPNQVATGPDPGNILLAEPLALGHPLGAPVLRQIVPGPTAVQPTVLSTAARPDTPTLLLADGNGYAPPALPALSYVRLTTPDGVFYHRVMALSAALTPGGVGTGPQMLTLSAPLDLPHPVGSPVVERRPLLTVQALDAGAWGNRLRISVEDEETGLVSRTILVSIGLPTQIRLGSAAGVEAGTILELLDPTTHAVVGGLLKVGAINRATGEITLDGAGLDAAQQAAHAAALLLGTNLGVRSREFRLTVRLRRQPDPITPSRNETVLDTEVYRYLSMDPRHSRYVLTAIGDVNGPLRLVDRRPEGESWYVRASDEAPDQATAESIRLGPETLVDVLPDGRIRAARHPLRGGDDSVATLTDAVYIGVDDPTPELRTGLNTLRNVEEISILACPGRTAPQIQNAIINQCELMRYRFAVLDSTVPPIDTMSDVQNQRQQFDTKYAALYYPWLLIPDPFPTSLNRIAEYPVPPSGHIVGVYARTDIERGVHKAPANEVVRGIVGLRRTLNKEQQDILNPYPVNINVIRDFRPNNRGIRVYGGRVMTSDPDWKYVNVRRLLIFLEASIDRGLQWVVFEPNAEPLWARVRRSISNFLTLAWR
ncbi:MAG TPA: phage tail sheath subtilisin-like domain-containing protein, partial [Armatimonadota bacterium]